MLVALLAAVVGWIFAAFVIIQAAAEKRDLARSHAEALAAERLRVDNLTAQLQANAQGLQFYPQLGPREAEPEHTYVRDETGLVEYDVTGLEDFAHVAGEFD